MGDMTEVVYKHYNLLKLVLRHYTRAPEGQH